MSPAEMAALHAACFETPRPWSQADFAGMLETVGVFVCTAPDGFAVGRTLFEECELLTIAVAPQSRRTGHGRALLAAFEAHARDGGATTAFLEVSAENVPACALYESQGYRRSGNRKGYYRTPEGRRIDALILRRTLD